MNSIPRIKRDLEIMNSDPPENCSAGLRNNNDLFIWDATIFGPADSPYHGGIFKLEIKFVENYPIKPPKMRFLTPIYHPNIDKYGNICIDILKNQWKPTLTIASTLLSICSLLTDPNPDDPLNFEAAEIYNSDIEYYKTLAQNYTNEYAMDLE